MLNCFTKCRITVLGLILLFVFSSGCNDEPITNVYISEDTDTFTVSGRVVSYPEKTPVAGASYSIMGGNQAGSCDQNGYFKVAGLSPGTYQVVVSGPGHATSLVTMALSGPYSKTNINQHREFYLLKASAELDLTVRGQDTGEVLSGVTVEVVGIRFPDWIHGHEIDLQTVPGGGQTDENGQVILTGMPATRVMIAARAHDADGDDKPDFGTQVHEYPLSTGETTTGHMVMAPYTGGAPNVIASNMPSGYSQPPFIAPSLYFIFSVPMQTEAGKTEMSLVQDNSPYQEIPMTATWTSPIRLELTPIEPLTDQNMDYDFSLSAFSEDGLPYAIWTRFYWQTGDDSVGGDCNGVVTDLVAGNPLGTDIDFNTRTIMLSWSAVSCAGGYRIYARDDRNNTQWTFLRDEPTDYETGAISAVSTLPPSFDRYEVDGIQTAFAGTEVTFCVVPKRATISTPGDSHGTVVVRDNQAPSMTRVTQIGNGINGTGRPAYLEFGVLFSEFIDPSVADPVIEVTEAGGDPAYTLDPASASWVWNAGRFSGQFIFEIPDGADASGDNIRVTINDLTDLSGNTTTGLSVTDWKMVELWGDVFDFETSPQGWTRTGDGWQWGSPSIGPGGAHGSLRCWGLSLDGNYGPNWTTDLLSPDIFVPGTNPVLSFWSWYYTDTYDDYVRVYADDGVTEVLLVSFHGNSGGWVLNSYELNGFAGKRITLRFNFTSNSYSEYPGFFLDDVTIDTAGK